MIKITSWNKEIDNFDNLTSLVGKAFEANKSFFGKDVGEIEVAFLYIREEMNAVKKQKTQDWVVGHAENDKIYIFSPTVFEKVSNHPSSDFSYTLTHEVAHIFTKRVFGFFYPIWFTEGLAGVVAEQYKIRKVLKEKILPLSKIHGYQDWAKTPCYSQAFNFTHYLFEKYGKERVFEFCALLGERDAYREVEAKFQQVFGDDLLLMAENWKSNL